KCGAEVHTLGPRRTSDRHHIVDPLDLDAVTAAVREAQPAQVFHLAGTSGPCAPSRYYSANTLYAAVLLEALDAARVACPVLLVGTSAEYGAVSASQLPITEDAPPRPYSHYGISKLAQTQMGLALAVQGRAIVVVRPFNIIGPGMPPHGAVQSFAHQVVEVIKGRRPPVIEVGNLDTTRDFVAVEDAVPAYIRLVRHEAAYGHIVNVCSGVETSMRAILTSLIAEAGRPIEVRVDRTRVKPVDVERHYGSTARLRALLGASPSGAVAPMLKKVLDQLVAAS